MTTDGRDHFFSLMRQARAGSGEAVGELIESVRTYLLLVANQEIDAQLRPKVAASDLVQDACLVASEQFAGFRGSTEGELHAWLRQVLLNQMADSRRKYVQSQKRQVSREVGLDGGLDVPARQISPRTSMIAREESGKLMAALQRVPEDYRTVLRLRNWDLLSFDEIGKQLDRSADAAQKLWTRAVKRLEEELREDGS